MTQPAPKLALRYAAFCVGAAGCAALLPWPVVQGVLLWLAISTAAVAGSFAVGSPAAFGKRPDGRLAPASVLLLLPYLVQVWGFFWLKRVWLRRDEPLHFEVAPNLVVGRRPLAGELPPDTRVVVDLTCEFPEVAAVVSQCTYECLPTLNRHVAPDRQVDALIGRLLTSEGLIYVHCGAGRGRSPALAALLLIRRGDATDLDAALAILRRHTPAASLHAAQETQVTRLCRPTPAEPAS